MDIRISKDMWIEYVPDYEDNRSLKEEEQIVVEVHGLSYGEQQKYAEQTKLLGKGGKKGFKTNASEVNKKMFLDNVRKITNLTFSTGEASNKQPCTSPGQLWTDGPPELVQDIVDAIQDRSHLEEGDIKNLSA